MFNVRLCIYLGVDWGRNEESTSRHPEQCGGVPSGFITTWKFCSGLIKLIMAKSCSPSGSAGGSAEALGWESLLLFFYFVDIIIHQHTFSRYPSKDISISQIYPLPIFRCCTKVRALVTRQTGWRNLTSQRRKIRRGSSRCWWYRWLLIYINVLANWKGLINPQNINGK